MALSMQQAKAMEVICTYMVTGLGCAHTQALCDRIADVQNTQDGVRYMNLTTS